MPKPSICLSMIVKNEALVIERCLNSVLPLIDHWVVCDTGSTDGTQAIVRAFFAKHGKPGELHERPWRDFAHNRSEALVLARPHGDYSLIIDADDTVEIPEGFRLPELTADSYMLDIQDTSVLYRRTQLVRNTMPWRYEGVLHEFLTCDGAQPAGHLPLVMRRGHDGARRRDPQTYHKDAAVLEGAVLTETDPFLISRYTFYLAQSYRDCGEKEKALETYLLRADLGFWQEEIFVSLLQAARLKEALDHPEQEVIDSYLRAANALSTRGEALHGASRFCRHKKRFDEGFQLAKRGLEIAEPVGGLFVEPWIYEYGMLDELAVNGYWSGHYKDSLAACERILGEGKIPSEHHDRIRSNAAFAKKHLPQTMYGRGGRYIIVTPYYKEPREVIERCIKSVRNQTVFTEHIIVADGFPQDWLDEAGVRHIRLDRNHRDWGNTPRGVGCLIAAAERYDGIGLLDADCWLESDHVERCLEAASVTGGECDYVSAQITVRRPDTSILPLRQEPNDSHIDTNAFFFFKGSYHKLCVWMLMSPHVSVVCDRVFFLSMKTSDLVQVRTDVPTVNYVSTWKSHYKAVNETPPVGAKPNPDHEEVAGWIESLSERDYRLENRLIQADLDDLYPWRRKIRNAPSPTTSGATVGRSLWQPRTARAGTELMVSELRRRLETQLESINLQINVYDPATVNERPLVVWFHHNSDMAAVAWLKSDDLRSRVDHFVFVSDWQRDRYIEEFGVPRQKTCVIRNGTFTNAQTRIWKPARVRRFAYTSSPNRGLSVLLDAWEMLASERDIELHIWSSMRLYGPEWNDAAYKHLYDRADGLKNVILHGIVPNQELRDTLRTIDYIAYPSTFCETSCLAVIEAMAAGCRILCSDLGALPETTSGFARIYSCPANAAQHAEYFANIIKSEMSEPWGGNTGLAERQQEYCRNVYDWEILEREWLKLIDCATKGQTGKRSPEALSAAG